LKLMNDPSPAPGISAADPVAQPLLLTPIALRGVTARNRIVVSPMSQYCSVEGEPTDWHLVHLGKFAQGGAGIVFVEATAVERRGRITHGDTGIWDDAHIPGLSRIAQFVRSQGAIPAIQLAHAGRKASMARPWYGNGPLTQEDLDRGDKPWSTVAPTQASLGEGWIAPRAFQTGDFQTLLDAYKNAVRRAGAAGFEIIELHAAHGYLLHTFLSPLSNTRTDQYGGSRENRMRFPLEVARTVREAWPKSRPLFVRVSSIDDVAGGWSIEDTVAFAKELKAVGVDVVDCSSGGVSGSATAAQVPRGLGFQVPYAERVRKEVGIASMAVGIILEAEQAEAVLEKGQADLIAVGRQSQYNPNIAHHWAHDLGINRKFEDWAPEYGWWLEKRIRTMEGFATPTGAVKR